MISRYGDTAALLRDAGTPMPESVRPARGKNGDASALTAALTAHQDAEVEVTRVLGESAEAAEALRLRKVHVQRQREEARAAAERRRQARKVRIRRLIIAGGVLAVRHRRPRRDLRSVVRPTRNHPKGRRNQMSQLNQVKRQLGAISSDAKTMAAGPQGFKTKFSNASSQVQAAVGGSAQNVDKNLIATLQEAEKEVDQAIQALQRASQAASKYGASI